MGVWKMNERFEKLAMQANGHHNNFFDLNYKELDVFLEKFAELIVRECAIIVGSMEEPHQEIAQLVKEHFGVEE
jgi:hypothetical protein